MAMELILNFPDPAQVVVELIGEGRPQRTAPLLFAGPLTAADQDDLHWYLEVYPTSYATELDDERAAAIADRPAAVASGQLGTLAFLQGDLAEAERRYQEALASFQRLGEPETEAAIWH